MSNTTGAGACAYHVTFMARRGFGLQLAGARRRRTADGTKGFEDGVTRQYKEALERIQERRHFPRISR